MYHCAGKDYALLHAAPVVAVFILDHSGVPVPSQYEVQAKAVPAPDMHSPHFALICTQEQIKVLVSPSRSTLFNHSDHSPSLSSLLLLCYSH